MHNCAFTCSCLLGCLQRPSASTCSHIIRVWYVAMVRASICAISILEQIHLRGPAFPLHVPVFANLAAANSCWSNFGQIRGSACCSCSWSKLDQTTAVSWSNLGQTLPVPLLQVNRDTMSFATKLCHIVYEDGRARDVMKHPKTDSSKFSLPGGLGQGMVELCCSRAAGSDG